jgi:hypothetical protein
MSRQIFVVLLSFLAIVEVCSAQTQRKVPVEVRHSGKDSLGQRYAFEVKEAIRASQGMRLVTESDPGARIVAKFVTLEASEDRPGISTMISTTYVFDSQWVALFGFHITSTVEVCGYLRISECVRSTLTDIDRAISTVRTSAPDLWKQLSTSKAP